MQANLLIINSLVDSQVKWKIFRTVSEIEKSFWNYLRFYDGSDTQRVKCQFSAIFMLHSGNKNVTTLKMAENDKKM